MILVNVKYRVKNISVMIRKYNYVKLIWLNISLVKISCPSPPRYLNLVAPATNDEMALRLEGIL